MFIIWVPSHRCIFGNEKAEELAKLAASLGEYELPAGNDQNIILYTFLINKSEKIDHNNKLQDDKADMTKIRQE